MLLLPHRGAARRRRTPSFRERSFDGAGIAITGTTSSDRRRRRSRSSEVVVVASVAAKGAESPEASPTTIATMVGRLSGLREFGCGVTSRHARRCCRNRGGLWEASRKLVAALPDNQTTGPKWHADQPLCCAVVVCVGNRRKETRVASSGILGTIGFSVFCFWLAESGFPSLAPSNEQSPHRNFLRFPLASSAGRSVHTACSQTRQPPRFAEKVVCQLAGRAGKWNAVPLALNNQALDPFSKVLSLSGGYLLVLAWLPVAHVPAHVKCWGWLEQYQPTTINCWHRRC